MGYKKDDPCIKKAYDNERLFVLMARDQAAPATVIDWIKYSLGSQPREKLHEALDCALQMYHDCEAMNVRKQEDQDADILKTENELRDAQNDEAINGPDRRKKNLGIDDLY